MKTSILKNHQIINRITCLFLSAMIMTSVMIFAIPQPVNASSYVLFTYMVKVNSGYLALRTEKAYDEENVIGELNTGDIVIGCPVKGDENDYKYVYSPRLHKHGYVNSEYIFYKGSYDGSIMFAKTDAGYLALRDEKAFEAENETGKLNKGTAVIILDDSDPEYSTVYVPSHYQTGYVNKKYLVSRSNGESSNGGSDNSKPMLFPDPCKAEWQKTSDNRLRMHVQVKNNTGEKTITSFTLIILAVDVNGNPVSNGDGLYEETINKRIEPRETEISSDFYLPRADNICAVHIQIKSVRFSDGTEMEYPDEKRPSAGWKIYYQA